MNKKAILVGNGFTSQLIPEYSNDNMMLEIKNKLGNKFQEVNDLLNDFRNIDINDNNDVDKVLSSMPFNKEKFKLYFFDYYLKNEIDNLEISSVESLLKLISLFEYKQVVSSGFVEDIANEIYYNGGKNGIKNISHKFDSKNIEEFFSQFEYVFTTNFDLVLDEATKKEIFHLHGGFNYSKKKEENGEIHITRNVSNLNSNDCYLIWGINAKEKVEKTKGGFTFPMSFPINFSGYSILTEYKNKLENDDINEMHVFGYSGENDGHINDAITKNKNIKKLFYYCNPNDIFDKKMLKRIRDVFIKERSDIEVELISWDTIWEKLKCENRM